MARPTWCACRTRTTTTMKSTKSSHRPSGPSATPVADEADDDGSRSRQASLASLRQSGRPAPLAPCATLLSLHTGRGGRPVDVTAPPTRPPMMARHQKCVIARVPCRNTGGERRRRAHKQGPRRVLSLRKHESRCTVYMLVSMTLVPKRSVIKAASGWHAMVHGRWTATYAP